MKKVSRREFAKSAALAPLGLAAASSLLGKAEAAPHPKAASVPPKAAPPSEVAADHIFSIAEVEPFAAPLQFVRNEMPSKLMPFRLGDVSLDAGPLQQARDWNRGYMLRLPNDRLLHNFRVNAGLPSAATPLGGWESPTCGLRGHFVGHYLSACAQMFAATADPRFKERVDTIVDEFARC